MRLRRLHAHHEDGDDGDVLVQGVEAKQDLVKHGGGIILLGRLVLVVVAWHN